MADTAFNDLLTREAWRRAVILGDEGQRAEMKWSDVEAVVNVVDGVPGALNASILPIRPAAEPAAMTERLSEVPNSRMEDLTPVTSAYVRYVRKYIFRDMEWEALVNSGQWAQLPRSAYNAIYGHLRGAIETKIKGSNSSATLAVAAYAGSTEAFAANHTVAGGTYQNYVGSSTGALSLANAKTAMTAFAKEMDIGGHYTNRMPRAILASDFGALYQTVRSKSIDSTLAANPGELLTFILMPGLGNTWALSSGPTPGGLTLEFRQSNVPTWGGRPYVGEPYFDEHGRVCIRYGCDYAILAGGWEGLYVCDPDW